MHDNTKFQRFGQFQRNPYTYILVHMTRVLLLFLFTHAAIVNYCSLGVVFLIRCSIYLQQICCHIFYEHFTQAPSTSKSKTISLVSSVPLREPTAHINFVSFALKKKSP